MKFKNLLILGLVAITTFVSTVVSTAQYFVGTQPKSFNVIPNNEGTPIMITLLGTNLPSASSTTNLPTAMNPMELPAGRDVGLLVQGYLTTTNAEVTINYQLSPDNAHWSWPDNTVSTGVINSNSTAFYGATVILSNNVTYPFRYWRINSLTIGTNTCYVSNLVAVYKSNPTAGNNYSR